MLKLVIGANVAIYLAMAASAGAASFSAQQLFAWGASLGAVSLDGQPWRLLTANYLHASLLHIGGNMLLLGFAGPYVETVAGPVRAFATYTVCGLAGSLLSAAVQPEVVAVGASGAIAGLLGVILAFYMSGRFPGLSGAWIGQTLGINALYSFAPNVDWLAHAGGFGAGLACGGLLAAFHRPDGAGLR